MNGGKSYYLMRLSVYKYTNKKLKCDYSVIPIKVDDSCDNIQSLVSEEVYSFDGFDVLLDKKRDEYCYTKYSSEKKLKQMSLVFCSEDIENEEKYMFDFLVKMFSKKLFFYPKYKKFLKNKKIF